MENAVEPTIKKSSTIFDTVIGYFIFAMILVALAWNWDGFWQTNIGPLKSAQQEYLPVKYNQEQLKVSRIEQNNELLAKIMSRLEVAENESKRQSEIAATAKSALAQAVSKEEVKCQYYKTSLMVIKNLTRKYSEDELSAILRCTNSECEQIMNSKPEAQDICG